MRRHFRELGIDTHTEEFTVVGIGDMSGDVFGNGMLLRAQIRLVAAFDHRHIFLDPTPDAGRASPSGERLFALPRSSWADYDRTLISAGGGVWPRTAKSVPIGAEIRGALGIDDDVRLTPDELIRAILRAPVDLLCNGGIGTYVKAATRPHAEVGRQGQRRDPRRRRASCASRSSARAATSGSPSGAASNTPRRRPDQHRRDRQLGRRGLHPTTR